MPPTSAQSLLETLANEPGTILVCANSAIQRELLRCQAKRLGQTSFAIDRIVDFDLLLKDLARQQAEQVGVELAERNQLVVLWQQVLERYAQKQPEREIDAASLASEALQAWQYLLEWQIPREQLQDAERFNELRMADLCQQFEQGLESASLQSQLQLVQRCIDAVKPCGKAVLVTAGGALSPLKTNVLKACFAELEICQLADQLAECQRIQLPDLKSECHAAAAWALTKWQQQPGARIALIRTDGQLSATVWRRELKRILADQVPLHFNFPRPLETGSIGAATQLLQLNRARLSRNDARKLVNNPFWQLEDGESEARAHWERACCDYGQHWLSYRQWVTALRSELAQMQPLEPAAEAMVGRLDRFEEIRRNNPSNCSLAQWTGIFTEQLCALGWPGRSTSAAESTERWLELCQALQRLDALHPSCGLDRALSLLQQQVANLKQAPQRTSEGINLLDTLESALGFDYIWLMGSDHQNWPAAPQPNSLLPVALQQQFETPRCSAELEREVCIRLFAHLQANARELVFSISCIDPDQSPGFSPLLPACELLSMEQPRFAVQCAQEPMKWVDCQQAPPWPRPGEQAPGGSNLLDLMLGSPFVAFARWRLAATEVSEASDGLDAMQRGSLVHQVLELVWGELGDQKSLLALSDKQLAQLIEKSIELSLGRMSRRGVELDGQVEAGVKAWLTRLLDSWMAMEKQRPGFAVKSLEQLAQIALGPIILRLKLDRLDQLENGQLLLMDYKTGTSQPSQAALTESPPGSAQLPLYAISTDAPVDAVAIASVVADKPAIRGFGSSALLQSIKPLDNWLELQQQWHRDLEQLANDFAKGDARHFCRPAAFGRQDPLAPLHRQHEWQDLQEWLTDE